MVILRAPTPPVAPSIGTGSIGFYPTRHRAPRAETRHPCLLCACRIDHGEGTNQKSCDSDRNQQTYDCGFRCVLPIRATAILGAV